MDFFVKIEPQDTISEEYVNDECILCDEGKKYYNLLVQHFQNYHKNYNLYEDGPILQYCKCAESVNYQLQIITHLLSHSILNQNLQEEIKEQHLKNNTEEEDEQIITFQDTTEDYIEDYDRFEETSEEGGEEEEDPESRSPRKRGRKRKQDSSVVKRDKKGRSLYCKTCQKQFDTVKKYYNHRAKTHREKLQCDQCEQQFVFKHKLREHVEHVHMGLPRKKINRPKKFQCDICSYQFSELRILNEHKNIHNDFRPFVCEYCSESFHNSANLRYHRKRHLNPDGYKCEVCKESFVNQQSLKKHHIRQHVESDLDPNRFVCGYVDCGSSFKYEDLLKQHIRKIHHRVLGEFICEICNFVTNNKQNYFQHRRRLHDIRNRKGNRVFPSSTQQQQEKTDQNQFSNY